MGTCRHRAAARSRARCPPTRPSPTPVARPVDLRSSSLPLVRRSFVPHSGDPIWRRGRACGQHDRHMVAIRSRLPRSILVLRHRDFALVQLGNGVSQLGTWGQYVALGWAIRELSGWPFAVSLSLVAQFLPFLLLSPIGGAWADRLPRRRIVVLGSMCAVPPSIALGVLVATGEQTIALLLALAALGGIATALTQPAMSAVVGEIVPEDELPEAVASMSIINNLTRILGPTLAALVISGWGLQWAFYLNAASFFAVVLAWAFVRTVTRPHETHEPLRRQIALGLKFAACRPADRVPAPGDVRGDVRRVPRRADAGDRDRPPARRDVGLRAHPDDDGVGRDHRRHRGGRVPQRPSPTDRDRGRARHHRHDVRRSSASRRNCRSPRPRCSASASRTSC